MNIRVIAKIAVAAAASCFASPAAWSAQGEMGVGVPFFGMYSQATGMVTAVWGLENATFPMPAGCDRLVLVPATMGMDAYKLAIATMLIARSTNRSVRFYAHGPRDDGCGVDYVQLN